MADTNTQENVTTSERIPASDRSLAVRQAQNILTGERGLKLTNYEEMCRFAAAVAKSKFKPVADWTEVDCFICLQKGAEVGMTPMQSLESIYVVNNRATLFGDAPKGLIEASGLMLDYEQHEEGKPFDDDYKWIVTSLRKGRSKPLTTTYSVADAKLAKLWGKVGAWSTSPKRMLMFRARGFNLRDNFSDVLKGFTIGELVDEESIEGFENAKLASAKIVKPNFSGNEAAAPSPVGEPDQPRRRGRPPKNPTPAPATEPAPEPKPEVESQPATQESPATSADSHQDSLFNEKVSTPQKDPRVQIARKLAEAKISQEEFLVLLLNNDLIDCEPGDITTGDYDLGKVNPKIIEQALRDWGVVLQQLHEHAK